MDKKTVIAAGAVAIAAAGLIAGSMPSEVEAIQAQIESSSEAQVILLDSAQQSYEQFTQKYFSTNPIAYQLESGQAYTIKVDEYVGPTGKGYIINFDSVIDGVKYNKGIDKGVESRSLDWHEIKPSTYLGE